MLTEKDLIELRNERHADYVAEAHRDNIKREAIANANAELNNLCLPNVHAMAQALKYLAQQASLGPCGLPETNQALQKALAIVDSYDDGSTGANL